MELKYLQTFKTIVEEDGFSNAAKRLNYTQSTITFQVGQLEQELSACLFEKAGRRMILTKAGEQLYPYVKEVLASLEKMQGFQKDMSQYRGNLRIGAAETLLCYRLPGFLKDFHRSAPNTRLLLQSMNCYDIRDALLDGTLDLGVFYEDVGGFGGSLSLHPLGSFSLSLVASPELKAQYGDFITPGRTIPVPFIINEKNCIFRQIFERYLQQKSILLDHTIELWSIPTIKHLVQSSVGVSFLPTFTVEEELASGELEEIPTDIPLARISAVCACRKTKWVSPAMELFIRCLTGM